MAPAFFIGSIAKNYGKQVIAIEGIRIRNDQLC